MYTPEEFEQLAIKELDRRLDSRRDELELLLEITNLVEESEGDTFVNREDALKSKTFELELHAWNNAGSPGEDNTDEALDDIPFFDLPSGRYYLVEFGPVFTYEVGRCPRCKSKDVWEVAVMEVLYQVVAWEDGKPRDYGRNRDVDSEAGTPPFYCPQCGFEFEKPDILIVKE